MIKELSRVILLEDVKQHYLKKGDIGTVVMVHEKGKGYEVEFIALDGDTIAVVTLDAKSVRTVKRGEIAHARELV